MCADSTIVSLYKDSLYDQEPPSTPPPTVIANPGSVPSSKNTVTTSLIVGWHANFLLSPLPARFSTTVFSGVIYG